MAAGEHGDGEIAGVERVEQVGEQLAGGAGVGMEEAVHDQEPLALGARRRAPAPSSSRFELLAAGPSSSACGQTMRRSSQRAGVAHVPGIERDLLLDAQPLAAVDLGPAGDAGADRDALGDPVRQVARQQRPRADERHVAAQHVERAAAARRAACGAERARAARSARGPGAAAPRRRRERAWCGTCRA